MLGVGIPTLLKFRQISMDIIIDRMEAADLVTEVAKQMPPAGWSMSAPLWISLWTWARLTMLNPSCAQLFSHVWLCDPTDCSPPGSSAHGISQARILEWVAISFFRESSQPRDQTCLSCIGRWVLYHWATWEACKWGIIPSLLLSWPYSDLQNCIPHRIKGAWETQVRHSWAENVLKQEEKGGRTNEAFPPNPQKWSRVARILLDHGMATF